MANYYGYQTVDISTYNTFRSAIINNGFDCDNFAGAQCMDLFMLLNFNVGGYSSPPYVSASPNGYAYELWSNPTSRAYNASDKYDLIYSVSALRRGDMIVTGATTAVPTGHNAFCDADYDAERGYIPIVGQNQGGTPFPSGGAVTNTINWYYTDFLGAFRLKAWHTPTPPTPQGGRAKRGFKWVLYANKLRNKY